MEYKDCPICPFSEGQTGKPIMELKSRSVSYGRAWNTTQLAAKDSSKTTATSRVDRHTLRC